MFWKNFNLGPHTWTHSSKNAIPKIISYERSSSLHCTKVHAGPKCWWQRMKHFLTWIIQVNCNVPICKEADLFIPCLAPHNCPQGSISILARYLNTKGKHSVVTINQQGYQMEE